MWSDGQGDDGRSAPVVTVAPVRPRRRIPRTLVVAIIVGGLAFFAGMQVGAWGSVSPAQARVLPTPSPSSSSAAEAGPDAVAPTPEPSPTLIPAPPGSSAFVAGFHPDDLVASQPSGSSCVSTAGQLEVPRTRLDGPRMTFVRSWMWWCPVGEGERQAFILSVIDSLVQAVPVDAYAFSTADRGSGEALLPYAESPYAGTVTLAAHPAGEGIGIAVVLEERLAR